MLAQIKRWGNSFGVRLTKRDLADLGIREGETVKITVERVGPAGRIDLSRLPLFTDPDPYASENHDKYLGEYYEELAQRFEASGKSGKRASQPRKPETGT
jgi:hypothetical protein